MSHNAIRFITVSVIIFFKFQTMTSAPMTSEGAPVISLERTVHPDSMAIVWKPVLGASPPVTGYDLYVNDAKVGAQVRENNFLGGYFFSYTFVCDLIKLYKSRICRHHSTNTLIRRDCKKTKTE